MPDVFGLGVTISTPGFTMSGQSLMPFGLPLRTTNTIVDVYGSELLGRRVSQSGSMSPAFAIGVGVGPHRERHDVGLEAVDDGAGLRAGAAVRLADREVGAGRALYLAVKAVLMAR